MNVSLALMMFVTMLGCAAQPADPPAGGAADPADNRPVASSPAPQQSQQPAPAPAPADVPPFTGKLTAQSPVEHILDALDARGQNLTSLAADVTLTETDAALGDEIIRTGSFALEVRNDGSARSRVTFDSKQANNRITKERVEYLLDGPNLIDRTYRTKTQVTRQVLRPGEKLNLLKLGEGPFPLPIGQDRDEVQRMFDVKKIDTPDPDTPPPPPNTVHVQLVPRPGSQFAGRFQSIDAWVDLEDHMPKRIETVDGNGTTIRTTDLRNVRMNERLGDDVFALERIGGDWTQLHEAFEQ